MYGHPAHRGTFAGAAAQAPSRRSMGALIELKTASGRHLPLSREGQQRFNQIVARGLKHLGIAAQEHRPEKVVEALKTEFLSHILGGFDVSATNAHHVFNSTILKLKEGYLALTYHVPCSVVAERSPSSFTIGPVTFRLREQFFEQNGSAIQHSLSDFTNSRVGEVILARMQAFYSEFQWIASITVPPCDSEISRRRAHAGIQKTLDVFKLLVGSQRASHVKQAYDLTAPSDYVDLVSSVPGSFSVRTGSRLPDAILNHHWYEQVIAGPAWRLLQLLLSNYWTAWGNLDEIQVRFLDGLGWHSDAISEPDLGARIVKFGPGSKGC